MPSVRQADKGSEEPCPFLGWIRSPGHPRSECRPRYTKVVGSLGEAIARQLTRIQAGIESRLSFHGEQSIADALRLNHVDICT